MNRKTQTLAIAAALACSAPFANAEDYTFQPPSGSWHTPANWSPFGTPGAGDTATIPGGAAHQTCEISADDAACKSITIVGGNFSGRLVIKGKTLTLGQVGTATTSIIDGVLEFVEVSGTPATLAVHNWVTLDTASAFYDQLLHAAAEPSGTERRGEIIRATGGFGVRLRGNLKVNGSFTFLANVDHESDREVSVTSADDVMRFGTGGEAPVPTVSGTGVILVTKGGLIEFRKVLFDLTSSPSWLAKSDGRLEVTDDAPSTSTYYRKLPFDVTVLSGASITFDHNFECYGKLTLQEIGGDQPKVIVRVGHFAIFTPAPID